MAYKIDRKDFFKMPLPQEAEDGKAVRDDAADDAPGRVLDDVTNGAADDTLANALADVTGGALDNVSDDVTGGAPGDVSDDMTGDALGGVTHGAPSGEEATRKKGASEKAEAALEKRASLQAGAGPQAESPARGARGGGEARPGQAVRRILEDSEKALRAAGQDGAARELGRLRKSAERERFTVAVVGEFSRGKSTFLNQLLRRGVLPVGDLPTTAVLTRIRGHARDVLVALDESGRKVVERELTEDAWEDLTAKNFGGREFKGTIFLGIRDKWLEERNIELIDTPGAGDLDEARARVVGDALLACDGAVIAVSAISPLSRSERLFLQERLMSRRLPFLMLVVTKLDQIPERERSGVVRYIRDKLKSEGMDIPVFLPYSVEMDSHDFDGIMGMDKVGREIASWATYPDRVRLMERWLLGKTEDILRISASSLEERARLLRETDGRKRKELLDAKRYQITRARLEWGELRLQMQKRGEACHKLLLAKVGEATKGITERLQYEAAHAGQPQKWWEEDFPYRLKMEVTGMATAVDGVISRRAAEDARWYGGEIQKTFHQNVACRPETIVDKDIFGDFDLGGKMEFENLEKKRDKIRVGTTALTISGALLFGAIGALPTIATMGIGTGSSILTEHIFKKKIEEQREMLKAEIARRVPDFIQRSMEESEGRVEALYQDMIDEAAKSERAWLDAQQAAMEGADAPKAGGRSDSPSLSKAGGRSDSPSLSKAGGRSDRPLPSKDGGRLDRLSLSLEEIRRLTETVHALLGGMENEPIQHDE